LNLRTLKEVIMDKKKILVVDDEENIRIIRDLKEIIVAHRKSPVEFSRKDSFVICDGNYRLRTISPGIIKGYIEKAKLFIRKTSSIVSKDESIFR